MTPPDQLRRTPLHKHHRERGARLVPFAGWEMPVQYSGVIEEHLAVRTCAGLFDVSHMGEVDLRGPRAVAVLQRLTCNDVAALDDGGAQYSAILTPEAGILDDVIVYRRSAERFLVIVNAGNAAADFRWIREQAGAEADVVDRSDEFALLALQGPRAQEILAPRTDVALGGLASFRAADGHVAGAPAMIGRTGYTGEDGFEIMVPADAAPAVWDALLAQGEPLGLVPAGLGARDTLRLEAGLLLHGTDMTAADSPLEAGLDFIVKLDAGPFLGRDVLVRQCEEGLSRRLLGIEMIEPGIARHGHPVWIGGEARGEVTSGSYAPFLRKNIARGYLPPARAPIGTEVEVQVRGRRLRAKVVKTPFYRRRRGGSADGTR